MKTFALPPLLAAVAMFVVGAIFWISPFPYSVLGRVADDAAAAAQLSNIFPATGTYYIPGAYLDPKVSAGLMAKGPLATVKFVKEGHPGFEPLVLLAGFVHYWVVALLLTCFLNRIRSSFRGYSCVVKAAAAIGVIGAVLIDFSDPIWWHHPWPWQIVCATYDILVFVVAGLVLGAFLKPAASAPTPSAA